MCHGNGAKAVGGSMCQLSSVPLIQERKAAVDSACENLSGLSITVTVNNHPKVTPICQLKFPPLR